MYYLTTRRVPGGGGEGIESGITCAYNKHLDALIRRGREKQMGRIALIAHDGPPARRTNLVRVRVKSGLGSGLVRLGLQIRFEGWLFIWQAGRVERRQICES